MTRLLWMTAILIAGNFACGPQTADDTDASETFKKPPTKDDTLLYGIASIPAKALKTVAVKNTAAAVGQALGTIVQNEILILNELTALDTNMKVAFIQTQL